jgi:hypothetical protein
VGGSTAADVEVSVGERVLAVLAYTMLYRVYLDAAV